MDDQLATSVCRITAGYSELGGLRVVLKLVHDDRLLLAFPAVPVMPMWQGSVPIPSPSTLRLAGYFGASQLSVDALVSESNLPSNIATYLEATSKLLTLNRSPVMKNAHRKMESKLFGHGCALRTQRKEEISHMIDQELYACKGIVRNALLQSIHRNEFSF